MPSCAHELVGAGQPITACVGHDAVGHQDDFVPWQALAQRFLVEMSATTGEENSSDVLVGDRKPVSKPTLQLTARRIELTPPSKLPLMFNSGCRPELTNQSNVR